MVNITKSTNPIKGKDIKRDWHLIDASKKVLGRFTPEIVKFLQGKHKTNYVPYLDFGDHVVVINAKRVHVSGKKAETKIYSSYSGYPGGQKNITFANLLKKNPAEIIKRAVSGMLPKNKLRDRRLTRLFIYGDDKHPYENKFKSPHFAKASTYAKATVDKSGDKQSSEVNPD